MTGLLPTDAYRPPFQCIRRNIYGRNRREAEGGAVDFNYNSNHLEAIPLPMARPKSSDCYILNETGIPSSAKTHARGEDADSGKSPLSVYCSYLQPKLARIPGCSPRLFLYSIQGKRILGYDQTVYAQAHGSVRVVLIL